jgi:hypothetical protein
LKRAPDGTRTVASVQRVGADLEESVVRLGEDDWPLLAGTKREAATRQAAEAVLTFLQNHGAEVSRQEVLEALEGDNTAKVRALDQLVGQGLVTRTGQGRRGDPFRFSVFPSAVYAPDGKTETENRPKPAPGLAESRLRNSGGSPLSADGNQTESEAPLNPPAACRLVVRRARGWRCTSPPDQVRRAVARFYQRQPNRLPALARKAVELFGARIVEVREAVHVTHDNLAKGGSTTHDLKEGA